MKFWRRLKNIWRLGEYRIDYGEIPTIGTSFNGFPKPVLRKEGEEKSEKKLATIVMPEHDTTD